MTGVNTNAFLDLLTTNAETIQQNSQFVNQLGNLSAASLGSSTNAVQAAQNASNALNAFEVTLDGLNERIIDNSFNISDNKNSVDEYRLKQQQQQQQLDELNYNVNQGERHVVNKLLVNTDIDPIIKKMGLNEPSDLIVKRAYAKIDQENSKVLLNDVETAKVGQCEFDKNGRLSYKHENVLDILKLPFYSQGSKEEYAKFTATNVWEQLGSDTIIPEPTGEDTAVRVQFLQQMKELKEFLSKRRTTLASERLLKIPGEYKPFSSLGGNHSSCSTSLSPEEIKEKYIPTTFGTIPNEAVDNIEDRSQNIGYEYSDPERTNPYTHDFMIDYNQFVPVYLGNSEKISWLHWLISYKLLNVANIMPVFDGENGGTLATAGFDKNYSVLSNKPNTKEYWNINSIRRLWPDSDILHINANVDEGAFGDSVMETFSLLAKSTVCLPIEFIIDEMENHPEEYENMSGNDTFLKLIMRLFKSEEKYQKAKYTTANFSYVIENTVNGHLPAIDPTKPLKDNMFKFKPLEFDTVIEYDVTDAGYEYFVSQSFESVQDIYNALKDNSLVRRKVVDNTRNVLQDNADISIVSSSGSYGTSSFLIAGSADLPVLKEAKSGLVYDDLRLLKDKLGTSDQLNYALKEGNNKNLREIVGHFIFADTSAEEIKEVFASGDLDVNFGKLEGVEANKLSDYSLYNGRASANLSVTSDLDRLALLIFSNRYTTWKLLNDNDALGNKYAMSTEESKEYLQKMYDNIKANYVDEYAILFPDTDFTNEIENFDIIFNTSETGVSESFVINQFNKDTYTVTRSLIEKGMVENMNYTIVDTDYNSTLQQHNNVSHPILKERTPILKDGLANELSTINSKTPEENLSDINSAFDAAASLFVYPDIYRNIMSGAALQLQDEKNIVAVDGSMNENDIVEAVFKFLNTAIIEDNLEIFERMHQILKEKLYSYLELDIDNYVPITTKGVILENHTRISGANVAIVVKSFTAAFILQDVCKISEAKVLSYNGSGSKINWLFELSRYTYNSVLNTIVDNNSQPLFAYSGMDMYNDYNFMSDPNNNIGVYNTSEGLVNWNLGIKYGNNTTSIKSILLLWSKQFIGTNHPINNLNLEKPYNPMNYGFFMNGVALAFGNSNQAWLFLGGYQTGFSYSEKLQKIAMAYRILPFTNNSLLLNTDLGKINSNNDLRQILYMFLNSTINKDEYPIIGPAYSGITDPVGLEEGNQIVLSLFREGTILRSLINEYITLYGSIKPIFAMGNFISLINLFNKNGFINDPSSASAHDILIEEINNGNAKITKAITIYNSLLDLRTSESISEINYSKSVYPTKVPVDGNGIPLLLTVESTFANMALILNQDN